ncbi:MAG: NUDIX hydrolase [Bacteroidetes bacterium]|nr:MAG: NUDIX hydrolase [Bacteroidota bacterium]
MYTYPYPRPAVTVDALVFRKAGTELEVLLIKRRNPPFKDMWAAPGGFINIDETPEDAVHRELQEETGIKGIKLYQYHTYGAVNRDPRHRTISIAYAGMYGNSNQEVAGGDDAAEAGWFKIRKLPPLAFDHNEVVADALDFGEAKGWF